MDDSLWFVSGLMRRGEEKEGGGEAHYLWLGGHAQPNLLVIVCVPSG